MHIPPMQPISPEKCRALSCTVMAEADYDSLLEAARATQSDPHALKNLFEQHLPQYLAPTKRAVGRHPNAHVAFLILESLEMDDWQKRLVLEHADIWNQRSYLAVSWKLKSAKEYAAGGSSSQFRNQKPIPAKTCKNLLLKVMPKNSDMLLEAARNAGKDQRALQALFASHIPHYRKKPKGSVGQHPDSNAAFLILEILGFNNSQMADVLSCSPGKIWLRRDAFILGKNLPNAEDFKASRRNTGGVLRTERIPAQQCRTLSLSVISAQTYDTLRIRAEAVKNDIKASQAVFLKFLPAFQKKRGGNHVRHPHVYVAFLILESLACAPSVMKKILDNTNVPGIKESIMGSDILLSVKEALGWRTVGKARTAITPWKKAAPDTKTKSRSERSVKISRSRFATQSLKKAESLSDVYSVASKFFPGWRLTKAGVRHSDNRRLLLAFHAAGLSNADIEAVMLSNAGDVGKRLEAAGRTPNTSPSRFTPRSAAA